MWFDVPPSGMGASVTLSAGQHQLEALPVLHLEQAREEVLVGVPERELRLEARDVVAMTAERHDGATQLQRLGPVLGVVDGDVLTGGEGEAVVERCAASCGAPPPAP